MSKRKFKIVEEGYWAGNGCDCCEPDYFPTYRVFEIVEGSDVEVFLNGTPHELEDVYHGILTHLGIDLEVVYED